MKETEIFHNITQVAHQIGKDNDALYIQTFLYLDTATDVTTIAVSTVVLNLYRTNKSKELFTGSYKECYNYIQDYMS